MASPKKQILVHKKQEKRIIKLAIKSGVFDKERLKELYWAEFRPQGRPRRKNKNGYRWGRYYQELYYATSDYWGECNEHSIVSEFFQMLYYGLNHFTDDGDRIGKNISPNTRPKLIKYLKGLKPNSYVEEFNYPI